MGSVDGRDGIIRFIIKLRNGIWDTIILLMPVCSIFTAVLFNG